MHIRIFNTEISQRLPLSGMFEGDHERRYICAEIEPMVVSKGLSQAVRPKITREINRPAPPFDLLMQVIHRERPTGLVSETNSTASSGVTGRTRVDALGAQHMAVKLRFSADPKRCVKLIEPGFGFLMPFAEAWSM